MNRIIYFLLLITFTLSSYAKDTFEEYIREYPNQEQVKIMNAWLEQNEKGTFQFTGLVDPSDGTVVSPQATVDYGYNWFSVSDEPAIIYTPSYDSFFSVSIFDMKHNIPAVVVSPDKPILVRRPNQKIPEGDFTIVTLETDQGLAFTRMVVVDNMKKVRELSKSIKMTGGKGDMNRNIQRFSENVEKAGLAVISATIAAAQPYINPDDAFGKVSGDVGELMLAASVMIGQLGTPADSVRYAAILTDEFGKPFNGKDTYKLTVPAGIVKDDGYYSITVYGSDNKLLIPNEKNIYDRTTYSSQQNQDGTYTVTLRPDGSGKNGIPTGKQFYAILRAYVPVPEVDMTVVVENN